MRTIYGVRCDPPSGPLGPPSEWRWVTVNGFALTFYTLGEAEAARDQCVKALARHGYRYTATIFGKEIEAKPA